MVQRRLIKKIGVSVPLLGLGMMRLPTIDGKVGSIDKPKAIEMVDYCLSEGVNYFDTAYMYHDGYSADFMGESLSARKARDSFMLANKIPLWLCKNEEHMASMFSDQFRRCQTDYFDFYLIHALDRQNYKKVEEYKAYDFLAEQKKQGKIKYLGFSYHDNAEMLDQILTKYDFDFCQLQINYLDWDLQKADDVYHTMAKHGIQCMVMEPVRGGYLAKFGEKIEDIFKTANPSASIASWGIRFAASLENVACVLSGMSSMEQLKDNIATLSDFKPLTDGERAVLNSVLDEMKKLGAIPCTGCRYCMPCPAGVNIPGTFRAYNDFKQAKRGILAISSYQHGIPDEEKADNCIECRQCAEHCPQHLDIPELLKTAHAELSTATTPDRKPGYKIENE